MERDFGYGTDDRILDWPPGRPAGFVRGPSRVHQRLVVNPCLTFVTSLAAAELIRVSLHSQEIAWFVTGDALLLAAWLLLQFHCLDCGRTGWLVRSSRHVCAGVQARWRDGDGRRFRGPGVIAQLVIWSYLLVPAFFLCLVWLWSGP